MNGTDDTMLRARALGYGVTPDTIGSAGGGFSQWNYSNGQWYPYKSQQDMDRKSIGQQQASNRLTIGNSSVKFLTTT